MAGLVPAIHDFAGAPEDMDSRDKPGRDEWEERQQTGIGSGFWYQRQFCTNRPVPRRMSARAARRGPEL
jgi:hypothetical protein